MVDSSFSKTWMLPTDEKERIERGREIYAMVLRESEQICAAAQPAHCASWHRDHYQKALLCAGLDRVGDHGAITGLNRWGTVRAALIVGRAMPPAELITQQAEAISGEDIARATTLNARPPFTRCRSLTGAMHSTSRPGNTRTRLGKDCCAVTVWGGVLQEAGRTRYILRGADSPLDIWLINDVPVPELGAVIPVQWADTDPMLGPKVARRSMT